VGVPSSRIPEVRTERLLLRGWRAEDLPVFAAMNADPEVMEHFPALLTSEESDGFVGRVVAGWAANGFGLWAVEQVGDGTFLGFAGLTRPRFDAPFMPAVEVGWRFARRAWGKGFATEAGRASLAFGFDVVGLDVIVSFTSPANVRSWRVMERLGMTHDPSDDFDHPRVAEGSPLRRHLLYRLRRADWEERSGRERRGVR
jgi:ribosomal-protein-alanine N-acetyltransferase